MTNLEKLLKIFSINGLTMKVEIGSKYEKRKAELREKIRQGSIDSTVEDTNTRLLQYGCYFCRETIVGKMRLLRDNDSSYFVDMRCYDEAKRNVYLNGVPHMVH